MHNTLSQGALWEAFLPPSECRGKTPTPFPPHTGKVDRAAELVSDHVIPVYKLWVVKKKRGGHPSGAHQRAAKTQRKKQGRTRPAINC